MPNILTPTTLWNEFDDTLDISANTLSSRTQDGIKFEKVNFLGRETGEGRVKVYGVFACNEANPSKETVLIFPDSSDSVDEEVIKLFVNKGCSALMVDYRGEWDGVENYTQYPANIEYANTAKCGRHKNYVDESADKTSWYEWVALGLYARKYIVARTGSEDIAVVGIRDGGEIAWKLAVAGKFSCVIPVCAVGWLAYLGISKYKSDEQKLDNERYRFIGGIDSQAYAPFVRCPVLVLCSTNDVRFDYDRAYDTFSRINPEYAQDSIITYSVECDAAIDGKSIHDMFMFLDKYLKHRQIYIPQPAEITVSVDSEQNLIAVTKFDDSGEIESCGTFMAEDCIDSSLREWVPCKTINKLSNCEYKAYIDIYKEMSTLFVISYATYVSGFTVWSRTAVKKISGRFKNSCDKCFITYTNRNGTDGFCIADYRTASVGGIFLTDGSATPQLVTKAKGIKGVYSQYGLTTYRLNSPRYSPIKGKILKLDVFSDETSEIIITIEESLGGESFKCIQTVLGGVWQSLILESKLFKNANGAPLADFTHGVRMSITCEGQYAVNNVMWL